MNQDQLLKTYGALYGPEAGPWNLSAEQKYLEYRITQFFEENFSIANGADICNVGIGAGYWDRFLSYQLRGGSLTSIDIDGGSCEALKAGLANEGNPNRVAVLHRDVMDCGELKGQFSVVTMVGTTRMETGLFEGVLEMVFSLVEPGGSMYYQSLDPKEDKEAVEALAKRNGLEAERYLLDAAYGRRAQYWKFVKAE